MMTASELMTAYLAVQTAADGAAAERSCASEDECEAWEHGDVAGAPTFAKARELALAAKAAWSAWLDAHSAEFDAAWNAAHPEE